MYGGKKPNSYGHNAGKKFAGRRRSGLTKASGGSPKCGGVSGEHYGNKTGKGY